MDRNLGAYDLPTNVNDTNGYGDTFQWGRRADGHQCYNSIAMNNVSSVDQPPHSDFIINGSAPIDWRVPQNSNLWQGVNGLNNPCPTGFRIPTEAEFLAEQQSWSSNDWAGAFASPIKWSNGRHRSGTTGAYSFPSEDSRFWSSTINNNLSRSFTIGSSSAGFINIGRANGCRVRCIKD